MRPILSIVGKSDSGKTTLLEELVRELKQRGYKVAVIKHASDDFEHDKVGKDSWRLSRAGSEVAAISSPRKLTIIKPLERDLSPEELSCLMVGEYDLILTEGFKQSNTPKIEVHRKGQGRELLCSPRQLLAVVSDEPLSVDVPQFSRNEVQRLSDLIENRLLVQLKTEDDVDLVIDNVPVLLNSFVRGFLVKTLLGVVSALNGVKEVKTLQLWLRKKA